MGGKENDFLTWINKKKKKGSETICSMVSLRLALIGKHMSSRQTGEAALVPI
jgi:hypothetical protein